MALTLVEAELRLRGFRGVMDRVPAAPPWSNEPLQIEVLREARRYAATLEAASRHHLLRPRCLQRSLALHRWMRRQGLPSELRLGVRKEDGALRAHAWVELDGWVVNDPAAAVAPFAPLGRPVAATGEPVPPLRLRAL